MGSQGQAETIGGQIGDDLRLVVGAMSRLSRAEWWRLQGEELAAVIAMAHQVENQAGCVGVAALGEATGRGIPTADGAKDAARWYRGIVPVTPGQAQVREGLAEVIGDSDLEMTRDALVAGQMSVSHGWAIARTVKVLSSQAERVPERIRREAQALLVRTASRVDAAQLGRCASRMRRAFDPDAAQRLATDEDAQDAAQEAYLIQDSTGMFHLSATLSARAGACLSAARLGPLGGTRARQRRDTGQATAPASDGPRPDRPGRAVAGCPRRRARPLALRGGASTRLVITADLATVIADLQAKGTVLGELHVGQPDGWQISPLSVQTEACDADIVPVLTSGAAGRWTSGEDQVPLPGQHPQGDRVPGPALHPPELPSESTVVPHPSPDRIRPRRPARQGRVDERSQRHPAVWASPSLRACQRLDRTHHRRPRRLARSPTPAKNTNPTRLPRRSRPPYTASPCAGSTTTSAESPTPADPRSHSRVAYLVR